MTVQDPHLATGERVAVPLDVGCRLDRTYVVPTLRFRVCERQRGFTLDHRRQIGRVLSGIAGAKKREPSEHDGRQIRLRHECRGEILDDERALDEAAAESADGLGKRNSKPAELAHLLPDRWAVTDVIVSQLSEPLDR